MYDEKICDEYVYCLEHLKILKEDRRDYAKALLHLQGISLYPLVTPLERVIKALQRKIENYDSRIAKANKEFIKAKKTYKEYCAKKGKSNVA